VMQENDAAPWLAALRELLEDRAAYERESAASREAALRFVARLDAGEMERYLERLAPRAAAPVHATVESLTPDRRALLLERLRKRRMLPERG